uniref:COMM domain containing 4 n=1 Tax=Cyprinodon variegatus TaxID=28743 RepID=A0A3Q2D2V7_CYPVA
ISTLAKISSVKMKLLCAQVLKDLLGEGIDYEKVTKLTADAKFESGDIKASIAVLNFILSSASKHDVDSESLSSELQQLGLPKGLYEVMYLEILEEERITFNKPRVRAIMEWLGSKEAPVLESRPKTIYSMTRS